jgi:hypothetical protein
MCLSRREKRDIQRCCSVLIRDAQTLVHVTFENGSPSTNHNIARSAQHEGTATWFLDGSIHREWKSNIPFFGSTENVRRPASA